MDTIPLLLTSKSAVFCVPIDLLPPEFWQPYSEISIQVTHCYSHMTAGSCYSYEVIYTSWIMFMTVNKICFVSTL